MINSYGYHMFHRLAFGSLRPYRAAKCMVSKEKATTLDLPFSSSYIYTGFTP